MQNHLPDTVTRIGEKGYTLSEWKEKLNLFDINTLGVKLVEILQGYKYTIHKHIKVRNQGGLELKDPLRGLNLEINSPSGRTIWLSEDIQKKLSLGYTSTHLQRRREKYASWAAFIVDKIPGLTITKDVFFSYFYDGKLDQNQKDRVWTQVEGILLGGTSQKDKGFATIIEAMDRADRTLTEILKEGGEADEGPRIVTKGRWGGRSGGRNSSGARYWK